MPTTRSGEGIGFQDKDTINLEELSNTNGYLPMVQSGINYKVRPTELKRDAVAVCSTASATVGKTATVNNMPDFVLVNGTVITVYFENKNTAAEPTLNINNTGSWPLKLPNQANNIVIGSGCWNDGFIAEVKYVEISDNNKFFLLLGHNVASTNNNYTTLADGTTIYSKAQTDSTINGALANYDKIAQEIANGTDLDNIKKEGWYFCKDNSSANTITNKPSGFDFSFGLRVIKAKQDASGNIRQIFYPESSIGILERIYANSSWGSWEKIATETDVNNTINKLHNDNYNLFIVQSIGYSQRSYTTYSSRKFSDYDFIIFKVGTSSLNTRNTLIMHKNQISTDLNRISFVYGSGLINVDIIKESDTSFKADVNIAIPIDVENPTVFLNIMGIKIDFIA